MGYDVDRFVTSVNEGLLCCICRDVLEDPLQAPCEHAYCSACIMAWLVHHNNCPEDRRPLTAPLLRPLFRYMKNDLEQLQIRSVPTAINWCTLFSLETAKRLILLLFCCLYFCATWKAKEVKRSPKRNER